MDVRLVRIPDSDRRSREVRFVPNSGPTEMLHRVLLFRDDVHTFEALGVDSFLHHAGLFCFVDECRE
jgi:hypothetical protein